MSFNAKLTPVPLDINGFEVNKYELLEYIIEESDLPEDIKPRALRALIERERLGSTGLEGGIAVPHARIDGIDDLRTYVTYIKDGIEFKSQDGKPTHIVFTMLASMRESGPHVVMLAKIAKFLNIIRNSIIYKIKCEEDVIEYWERIILADD